MRSRVYDAVLYRGAPARLRGRFRLVAGVRMFERYAEKGGAPVVVLVHGVGVSSRYLLPTAAWLAPHCSVYAPDLPGSGRSSRSPRRISVPVLVSALAAWLDSAELHRPDALLAHSFGCQVAAELAARAPERVSRLVLVSPTAGRARSSATPQG